MSEEKKDNEKKSLLDADLSIGTINLEKKAMFAKHMSILLRSGLTIYESLEILKGQETGRMKKIIKVLLRSVEAGNTLSASFARFPRVFSGLFINTTLAGEKSGTLEENFKNIAEKLSKDKELTSKIKGAMVYPIIVLVAALIMGVGISFVILPKIMPMFEGMGVDLPFSTRMLIGFSKFMQAHKIGILSSLTGTIVLFLWFIKQEFSKPITNYILLKTPVINRIVINSNLASFCRTLGTLLKSGLHIDEALTITSDTVGNFYYKKALASISKQVVQGSKLSSNLKKYDDLFPRLTTSMIMVGEKSGNLEDTLLFLAEIYEDEVDLATKALATSIEPILLIGIGVVVGGLALSIIGPIYEITGKVQ